MGTQPGRGERESAVLAGVRTDLFVGGRYRPGANGLIDVVDPATEGVIAQVADADADDARAALDAAVAAAPAWAARPPRERGEILRRAFEILTARSEDLALIMTLEMGKPLAESRAEIAYAAEFLRWFSEESVRIAGRWSVAPAGTARLLTMKQPVGPCLFITPWNFPLAMGARKIGPAVAAGCTMVVKPATQTPVSMYALAGVLAEAGLPDGVLNVVTSSTTAPVMEPLIRDPRLRKLSFTGSTEVGRKLVGQSAAQLLRVSMELGGNAPFLVFGDADVDAAVEGAMLAKMRNMGEACTAANRFIVHSSVVDEFASRLAGRMSGLVVGHGTKDGVDVGPLIDAPARDKVSALVEDAVTRGAHLLTGGVALDGPGYFYRPTVLAGVTPDARLLKEEVFGPVAPIIAFTTDDEAMAMAGATEYGLVAYAFTRDLDRAFRVAEGLQTGMVGINQGIVSNPAAPFGGVKHSGFGREGGPEGIDEYLETKYVGIALAP